MIRLFKKAGVKLRNLSPAAIREIIVIALILCVSIILSIPQYHEDVEKERAWREMQKSMEMLDGSDISESTGSK